jgi:hypothetical protein
MDLNDPADVRVLLNKLWCHGQAIAPIQGFAYALWAITQSSKLSIEFRIFLWIAALKFPLWGYVSWASLQSRYGSRSRSILFSFGLIIILMDIIILIFALQSGELDESWPLLAFIATALHAIETTAFLSAAVFLGGIVKESYDSPIMNASTSTSGLLL